MDEAGVPLTAAMLQGVLQATVRGGGVALGSGVIFDRHSQRVDFVRKAAQFYLVLVIT